jgi:hypothetical protein
MHIHIVQIRNCILNDMLPYLIVNKKVETKNAARGKNEIYFLTLALR